MEDVEGLLRAAISRHEVEVRKLGNNWGYSFWGKHLEQILGVAKPTTPLPNGYKWHAHHILFKSGKVGKQADLVKEGQEILRQVGIDPLFGKEVFVWAPLHAKGQHHTETADDLVRDLKALWDSGSRSKQKFADILKKHGEIPADRRYILTTENMQIHDQMYDSIGEDLATFKNLYNSFPNVAKGFPWLYSAARNGSIELIEFLLQSGHSPDEQDGGRIAQSAITAAAGEASKRSLQLLLRAGASLKVDSLDDNPLIRSIQKFSLECVQLLVDAGIDIHKTYTLEDGRLRNASEFAVSRGCTDIADYLRSKGAVMPGENAKPQSRLYNQLNSTLIEWFQADTTKSAG